MEVSRVPLPSSSSPLGWVREIGAVCLERSLDALPPRAGLSGRLGAHEGHQRLLLVCVRIFAFDPHPHRPAARSRTAPGTSRCGYSTSSAEFPMNGPGAREGRGGGSGGSATKP
eukprot:5443435-Amphidinium_carterae.1